MKKHLKYLLLFGLIGLFTANTVAQTQTTRILFVLDGSGSMVAKMGDKPRIDIAKRGAFQVNGFFGY